MHYRKLFTTEINQLQNQGCYSNNWEQIKVVDQFDPSRFRNVEFIGDNKISISNHPKLDSVTSGIYNCTIKNCTVEDHALLKNIGLISNYIVRSHARIENCSTIISTDNPTFGNGTEVSPINEGGGREVIIYDQLNAPIAHLQAFMRDRPDFIKKLQSLIKERIHTQKEEKGIIGHHSHIIGCTTIEDVKIGDSAILTGVAHLKNGTIISSNETPTIIGHLTIAHNFIIAKGSTVKDGSILNHCFIGEGCIIDRQFSAEHTLVFANSQLYHGEACSAFCGPYTVSHHKSTLLIAGYFSFINIGSGSNQSNHMYKLGPIHQGVLERGCKLSSDSYLLWPGKVGPYTFVMGRHYSNPDIGDFPFSYLLDNEGISTLVPGANFRSIGTLRDAQKWPNRDIRKGEKSDPINFALLNPFIINKVIKAKIKLETLFQSESGKPYYTVGNVKIKKPAVKRGIDIYTEILTIYLGDLIYNVFKSSNNFNLKTLIKRIPATKDSTPEWYDLSGLLISESSLNDLVHLVESNTINKLSGIEKRIKEIFNNSINDELFYIASIANQIIGKAIDEISEEDLIDFLKTYKTKLDSFVTMLLKDAQKDFNEASKISYGYEDDLDIKQNDFNSVRGNLTENNFIKNLKTDLNIKTDWIELVTSNK